jgi:hypothetical protein
MPGNGNLFLVKGAKGLGGYLRVATSQATDKSAKYAYYSFRMYPAGDGARTGVPWEYAYASSSLRRHPRKKDAVARALALSKGEKWAPTRPVKSEKQPGTGWCMKERKRVVIADPTNIMVAVKGKERMAIRGHCPDCMTPIQKFGKVAMCPGCDNVKEMPADDYLCIFCREGS